MNKRLNYHSGNRGGSQENRMINDKYRAFCQALNYSYQAATIQRVSDQKSCRALINPDKNTSNYDDKILSVDYAEGFKCGDIIKWIGTNTYWILYLQEYTEDAYFRSAIRKCYPVELKWVHDNTLFSSYAYVRGPVETKINNFQKGAINLDLPNWSLEIYLPNTEEHREKFKRYTRFMFNDMAWEVTVVDTISMDGVIQLIALENYTNNVTDDKENNIADAFEILPVVEETAADEEVISGATFIKPQFAQTYTANISGGSWSIKEKNRPVSLAASGDKVTITWTGMVSGQFTLVYSVDGIDYEKTIIAESLF